MVFYRKITENKNNTFGLFLPKYTRDGVEENSISFRIRGVVRLS